MTVTVGINGFGRIGRCTLAHIAESARNDVQVVKINATGPIETNAHLLKYDSVHGRFNGNVVVKMTHWIWAAARCKFFQPMTPRNWIGLDVMLFWNAQANSTTETKRMCIFAKARNLS